MCMCYDKQWLRFQIKNTFQPPSFIFILWSRYKVKCGFNDYQIRVENNEYILFACSVWVDGFHPETLDNL